MLFVIRYLRLVVNTIAFWTLQPVSPALHPTFSPDDVTVILPSTLSDGANIEKCIHSILGCKVREVLLVVLDTNVALATAICKVNKLEKVVVVGVPKLGKRRQMVRGLRLVKTAITAFADDDVIWPSAYLHHLLAVFENPKVGAGGTKQRATRNKSPSISNFLGICYLERRNFNTGSTNHIDGGISTLSGRTAAYRTCILQNEEFYHSFLNDMWMGKKLKTDDDKFLTKWVFSHQWQIRLQFNEESVLYTNMESGVKFLYQCSRWSRAHWRGNLSVVMTQSYWYDTHVWTCYATYLGSLMTPSFLIDGILVRALHNGLVSSSFDDQIYWTAIICLVVWILLTKTIKLIPHFIRHPQDLRFTPVMIVFSYMHGFINIYALLTTRVTKWGSRAVADEIVVEEKTDIESCWKNATDLMSRSVADISNESSAGSGYVRSRRSSPLASRSTSSDCLLDLTGSSSLPIRHVTQKLGIFNQ